jgi:hypothetical protein
MPPQSPLYVTVTLYFKTLLEVGVELLQSPKNFDRRLLLWKITSASQQPGHRTILTPRRGKAFKVHYQDLCRSLLGCCSFLCRNLSFRVVWLAHFNIATSLSCLRLFCLAGNLAQLSNKGSKETHSNLSFSMVRLSGFNITACFASLGFLGGNLCL